MPPRIGPALTPQELYERVQGEQARRHLATFTHHAWHIVEPFTPLVWGWHLDAICEHLEAVTAGEIHNLLINMPPRSMKSTLVSVMWPMWVWTTKPGFRWLFTSYALDLAVRDSLRSRRVVESDWYQRHYHDLFHLAGDQNLKSHFQNDQGGVRLARSVGSGVTGQGGDAVVVDDPHNVKQAESQAVRESALEWWDQSISTRLNDPKTGAKVIVMQRLHQEDLSGHVLAQGGYVHLNLPMEYETARPCHTVLKWKDPRTQEGELLWPQRIGPAEVAALKRQLNPYGYAGQYQQRPTPRAGGTFQREWLDARRYRPASLPALTYAIQVVDSAFKEGVANDYSVIATWGTDGRGFYLLDVWRARVAFPGLLAAIYDAHSKWAHALPTGIAALLVEDKASGQSAIQTLQATGTLPVLAVPAVGSKESRADNISPLFEGRRVWLPEEASWMSDWIDEHVNFPRASHDDQVDTTSYALAHLKRFVEDGAEVPYATTTMTASPDEQLIRAFQQRAEQRAAARAGQAESDDPMSVEESVERHQEGLARTLAELARRGLLSNAGQGSGGDGGFGLDGW